MNDEFISAQLEKKQKEAHVPGEDASDPGTNKQTKVFIATAAIVLIGLLVFFFFGIQRAPKVNQVEYNYFTFTEREGLWETEIQMKDQPYLAVFRFNPSQVEDVNVSGSFGGFKRGPVYITFDPNATENQFKYLALGATELSLHMIRGLNLTVESACTENVTQACEGRPIVKCGEDKNVLYMVPNGSASVVLGERCITVSGSGFDLLKSIDRVLYQWYKIMS